MEIFSIKHEKIILYWKGSLKLQQVETFFLSLSMPWILTFPTCVLGGVVLTRKLLSFKHLIVA